MMDKVKWIFIAAFLDLFAVSLIIPSMSAHLKNLGASYFIIGMSSSSYAFMQLFSGPIIGSLSDKIGRQKIFVISYLFVASCYPIIGVSKSLYVILLMRATLGIFKHGQVLLRTIIADQIPVDQQTILYGQLKSVAGISFTIGPAIGGHLVELDKGFIYISCCTATLLALNSVIGYFYLDDLPINKSTNEDRKNANERQNISLIAGINDAVRRLVHINWLQFGEVFLLKYILDMSVGVYHSNYNLKIQERFELSPKISGYTIAFQSLVGVFSGLYIGKLNDKLYKNDANYRQRNLHGFSFMSIAYLGVYFASHLSVFLFWTVILNASHMFLRIVLTDMVMRRCPANQTGSVVGTANSVSNVARLVTPIAAGFVEDTWGTNSANFLAAIITVLGVGISLRIKSVHSKAN